MIPVNEPVLAGNELKYVEECVRTGWISSEGPFIKKFEEGMARRFGMKDAVAVCNGTAALEVALFALNLKPGGEIILPSFTIVSCVVACVRLGLKPVLVDIDPVYWTMDPADVKEKITGKTGAIMAVHIYGNPVDMDPIFAMAKEHGLPIVEDWAETHGASYHSKASGKSLLCGSMGAVSATSFYANKLITTGEGGMVLCKTEEQGARARLCRNLAFDKDRKFIHEEVGYNYRMTNMQAAVGLAQLEQLDQTVAKKKKIGEWYRQAFKGTNGMRFHPVPAYSDPVYWMYCVELDREAKCDAEQVTAGLKEKGIGTRYFFRGMHTQPCFAKMGLFGGESYPKTDYANKFGFYLPSSLNLTQEKVVMIAEATKGIIQSCRASH